MPAKIRLQRKGKKGQPFYHIVIADGRAPREGRFIEKIGVYNPLSKPAEIEINFEKALDWLQKGASPTDTVKAILSYKGVMYKNHLLKGVKKGAMTLETAEAKFEAWNSEKLAKIASSRNQHLLSLKEEKKRLLTEEEKVNEAKAEAIAKKNAKAMEAKARSEANATEEVAEAVAEVPVEAAEEAHVEATEEAPAETAVEAPAETPAEEPKQD
jgi:small subunit ribosomal protein S16